MVTVELEVKVSKEDVRKVVELLKKNKLGYQITQCPTYSTKFILKSTISELQRLLSYDFDLVSVAKLRLEVSKMIKELETLLQNTKEFKQSEVKRGKTMESTTMLKCKQRSRRL